MKIATSLLLLVLTGQGALIMAAPPTTPSFAKKVLEPKFYCEGAAMGDVDSDGQIDIVAGPYWYAGPEFSKRFAYYPPKEFKPTGYSDNFLAWTDDINGDKWLDIVVAGYPNRGAVRWYENPADKTTLRAESGAKWKQHLILNNVGNESPAYVDLTGDGNKVLVCHLAGHIGYASRDVRAPKDPWKFQRIGKGGHGHGLGVGDVNADGRLDVILRTGWLEQPEKLSDGGPWDSHEVAFTKDRGGAQMFAYDVDGDGDNDIITSLNGHGYGLSWFEHQKNDSAQIVFKEHLIMGAKPEDNRYGVKFSQLHALALADINGDGLKDIVTGKRFWAHGPKKDAEPSAPAVLYWFQLVQNKDGVDFVPHQIDADSGVGTQVLVGDVNGDRANDVVVGNKKGTFIFTQQQ